MLQRRMRSALAAASLAAVLALTAPVQAKAAGFRAGAESPNLWTAALRWLGGWWTEVGGGAVGMFEKVGSGIDPNGGDGQGSGTSPTGSSPQSVEPPIEPDKGSGIDPNG